MKRVVRARDVGMVFDSEYFEYYFAADLGRTDYVALIQSAFVTRRGVRRLTPAIKEARARGVRICMFIQELRNWRTPAAIKSDDERNRVLETKAAIKMLEEMGVHVTVRRGRHEKIAVLDEIVLYDGSLNKMSYTNETNERITRSVDVEKASEAIILQRLYECRMCQLEVQPWQKHVILQPESLGEVIGKRRRWSELSQREIAERAGVHPKTICDIERHRYMPRMDALIRILNAIDHDVVIVPKFLTPAVRRLASLYLPKAPKFRRKDDAGYQGERNSRTFS